MLLLSYENVKTLNCTLFVVTVGVKTSPPISQMVKKAAIMCKCTRKTWNTLFVLLCMDFQHAVDWMLEVWFLFLSGSFSSPLPPQVRSSGTFRDVKNVILMLMLCFRNLLVHVKLLCDYLDLDLEI